VPDELTREREAEIREWAAAAQTGPSLAYPRSHNMLIETVAEIDRSRALCAEQERTDQEFCDWLDSVLECGKSQGRSTCALVQDTVKQRMAELKEAQGYIQDIARALHPHKTNEVGWTFLPDQLAGMVTELFAKLAAAQQQPEGRPAGTLPAVVTGNTAAPEPNDTPARRSMK